MTEAVLSEVSNGAKWDPDPSFSIADALLDDPEFASVLKVVLRDGHVVVPVLKAKKWVRKDFKTLEEMAANLVSAGSQAPEITGTVGRLISVIIIMIFGVTLFFNLARALLTPSKVLVSLPDLRPAAPR
jgi:hypothetical protein